MNERTHKIIKFYAHDYRGIEMSENDLRDMLEGFTEALECKHQCTSNCRQNGCACECGNFHF